MILAETLIRLVAQNYPVTPTGFASIHLFESNDRGVYKVERGDGPPLLLRACRSTTAMADRLLETAGGLEALAAVGYPAPVVQRTNDGSTLAGDGEWSGLLLTFVEGELAAASVTDKQVMGEMLARLHLLDVEELRKIEPKIPFCRWHPISKIEPWLTNLNTVADLIPSELESRYQFCVDTVTNYLAWPEPPISLLHTDCNPQNAVCKADGQMVFIDWDGIGLGPAIMDLAYLVFHCHILQDSWPVIVPNGEWIEAIIQGYCEQRALSQIEVNHLVDAIALVECHHLARGLPNAVRGEWTQNRGLTRFYEREKIVPLVAEMALASCNG